MARKDPRIEAAEDELIACMGFERRLPDREAGWLYHSTLRWPAMLRDQGDYPGEEEPRSPLSRRELARYDAMFGECGFVERAIGLRDMALVALVARMRARQGAGGFGWDDVWNALRGKLCKRVEFIMGVDAEGEPYVVETVFHWEAATSNQMRMRYNRALAVLAGVIGAALDPRSVADSTPAGGLAR
jgi:hypothetical protein